MSEKTCRKCGLTKPLSDFRKDPRRKSGVVGPCKACSAATKKARRQTPSGKARTKADKKKYAASPHGRAVRAAGARRYHASPNGKAVTQSRNKKYIETNPLVYKSHKLVSTAIRHGQLKQQPCEVCGEEKSQAHHDDYAKPLEVRWLCRLHHAAVHKFKTETAEVLNDQARIAR